MNSTASGPASGGVAVEAVWGAGPTRETTLAAEAHAAHAISPQLSSARARRYFMVGGAPQGREHEESLGVLVELRRERRHLRIRILYPESSLRPLIALISLTAPISLIALISLTALISLIIARNLCVECSRS